MTAKTSEDGKTLSLQVVNLEAKPVAARIVLAGFTPGEAVVGVCELTGNLDDVNTPENPTKIVPRERTEPLEAGKGSMGHVFPPHSFTILRYRGKS
ncbi:MAG: alpha-L-arabinofuranosidase C-terminal domain-containing protein [Pirellulales bacterium]